MNFCLQRFPLLLFSAIVLGAFATETRADSGDTAIAYRLGLAAQSEGDDKRAAKMFKRACLAVNGSADACIAWADVAEKLGNDKDVKRALGSVVMLAPEDVRGRTRLAEKLIAKKDFTWAREHLEQAIPHARTDSDRAILRYYYAYVLYKTKETELADEQFTLARPALPENYQSRCDYYQALIASQREQRDKSIELLKQVAEGPDPAYAEAVSGVLQSWSAFPLVTGLMGRVSGSFGLNTHPSSAFLDDIETDSRPVLQSIFRGDAIYNKQLESVGLQGIFTFYREQNWKEVGKKKKSTTSNADLHSAFEDEYSPQDFNTTVFLGQASLITQTWGETLEHQLKFGVDGELQFLDHPPIRDKALDKYFREKDLFKMTAWAVGGRFWWSFAPNKNAISSVRLKVEGRPNYIDPDRSTIRARLRLHQTLYMLERAIQLKLMIGSRYDRAYEDPKVIKYDRFLPEAQVDVRWHTPVPRLTFSAGGLLKYNWYMNSRQNEKNSFRPKYVKIDFGDDVDSYLAKYLNSYFAHEYYNLTRGDLEWEVKSELLLSLWKGANLALMYNHHERLSNIDDAPVGGYITVDDTTGEEMVAYLPPPEYSYKRDTVMLELRQRF